VHLQWFIDVGTCVIRVRGDREKLNEYGESREAMDVECFMFEMTRALEGCGQTTPGEDSVCSVMFKHTPDSVLEAVLGTEEQD
jgi:hypothetical protein